MNELERLRDLFLESAARKLRASSPGVADRCDCAFAGLCTSPCIRVNGVWHRTLPDCPRPWMPAPKEQS